MIVAAYRRHAPDARLRSDFARTPASVPREILQLAPISPRIRLFLTNAGRLILVHLAFAMALAATVDIEIVLLAPLVTLFAMPALLVYAILSARQSARDRLPAGIFLLSFLPFLVCLAYCSIFAAEGRELARLVLGLYVLPAVHGLTVELMFKN